MLNRSLILYFIFSLCLLGCASSRVSSENDARGPDDISVDQYRDLKKDSVKDIDIDDSKSRDLPNLMHSNFEAGFRQDQHISRCRSWPLFADTIEFSALIERKKA